MAKKPTNDQVYFITDMIPGMHGAVHPYTIMGHRVLLTKEEAARTLLTSFALRPEDKQLYLFKLEEIIPRKRYAKKGK